MASSRSTWPSSWSLTCANLGSAAIRMAFIQTCLTPSLSAMRCSHVTSLEQMPKRRRLFLDFSPPLSTLQPWMLNVQMSRDDGWLPA